MQSQFKHKLPKKDKVDALEFAQGFLTNVSASADTRSESISKAVTKAQEMAQAARNRITADEKSDKEEARLSMAEIKGLRQTANFWDNIAGHVPKVFFK
jgi:uncharacterized alpha-E superfamily protein